LQWLMGYRLLKQTEHTTTPLIITAEAMP